MTPQKNTMKPAYPTSTTATSASSNQIDLFAKDLATLLANRPWEQLDLLALKKPTTASNAAGARACRNFVQI